MNPFYALMHLSEQVSGILHTNSMNDVQVEVSPGENITVEQIRAAVVAKTQTPSRRRTLPSSRLPRPKRWTPSNQDAVLTGRIAKKWSKCVQSAAAKGLHNPGTFCYRNAVLQCLIHLPEVNHYLDNIHENCEKTPQSCVVCSLQRLFRLYWLQEATDTPKLRSRLNSLNHAILKTVPTRHPMEEDFKRKLQSDPFDFFTYLCEEMRHKEQAGDLFQIADLFAFRYERRWTCTDCGNVESYPEAGIGCGQNVGLSLHIQEPKTGLSMLTYLRTNFFEEELDIRCETEQCVKQHGKMSESKPRKRLRLIIHAPELLAIRLSRFYAPIHPRTGRLDEKKITNPVMFEEYVNLGEFTESEEPLMYKLQGVVAHTGSSVHSGHYIAAVKSRSGTDYCSINDDQRIGHDRGGTLEELQFPKSFPSKFDPYVLFYSKM